MSTPPRGSTRRRTFTRARIARDRAACPATHHGTRWAYDRKHCRCCDACEAHRLHERQRTARRGEDTNNPRILIPATGTARRLESLITEGHTLASLGHTLHTGGDLSKPLRRYQTTPDDAVVARGLAQRIARLHAALAGRCGTSNAALHLARRRNYAPRWAWNGKDIDNPATKPWHYGHSVTVGGNVDDVAVQRVLAAASGHRSTLTLPHLNPDETAQVVGTILTTHPNPAARLLRVFEMNEDAGRDYASKVRDRGGVSLRMLTEPDSAHYWTVRPHPLDPPLKALQQTEWAA